MMIFECICASVVIALSCCLLVKTLADRRYEKQIEALKEDMKDIKKEIDCIREVLCQHESKLLETKDNLTNEIYDIWRYLHR